MDIDLDNTPTLSGWTKNDKFDLLQALKSYNSDDPQVIHEYITHKTPKEIKEALDFYNEKAQKLKPKAATVKRKTPQKTASDPLAEWAEFLTDKYDLSDLPTETAHSVRLIAHYEEFPPPTLTDTVDFKKIYHLVANAIEGKPLPEDQGAEDILNKCIYDVASTSKTFIKSANVTSILSKINSENNDLALPVKQSFDNEIACITDLASQKSYNPFNIPEKSLKYQS